MKRETLHYVVDHEGKRTGVILTIEEYQELLEDIHDLARIAERREEPTVSFDQLKESLVRDGLL